MDLYQKSLEAQTIIERLTKRIELLEKNGPIIQQQTNTTSVNSSQQTKQQQSEDSLGFTLKTPKVIKN